MAVKYYNVVIINRSLNGDLKGRKFRKLNSTSLRNIHRLFRNGDTHYNIYERLGNGKTKFIEQVKIF
jgi:hypothetical protein